MFHSPHLVLFLTVQCIQVVAAEAEQLKVAAEVDNVYNTIDQLRDDVNEGRSAIHLALEEILDLHCQCQQLEKHNQTLAARLNEVNALNSLEAIAFEEEKDGKFSATTETKVSSP